MEKKRKFLFVSLTGLVGDIAWQVRKEGHEVRYFIGDPEEKDIAALVSAFEEVLCALTPSAPPARA